MPKKRLRDWPGKRPETFVAIVLIVGIIVIGFLVYNRLSFLNFFFLPVIFSGYYLGKKKAVLAAVACILLECFFLILARQTMGARYAVSFDDVIFLMTWAGFLILTAAIIGTLTEKRSQEMFDLKKAYTGVLAIMLKYLEAAGEEKSRPERISSLAGKIAEGIGLERQEVENIKSAALLSDVPELRNCMPIFLDTNRFMDDGTSGVGKLSANEIVLLKTTAALLTEIHPLLESYFLNYGHKDPAQPADLDAVPVGASVIALAELYERVRSQGKVRYGGCELRSAEDLLTLCGKYFPQRAVEVLLLLA